MTTFADHLLAMTITHGHQMRPGTDPDIIREAMSECTRYVIRPDVEDIAMQIMDDTPRELVPWPLPLLESVWLEMQSRVEGSIARTGLLLRDSGAGVLILESDRKWVIVPIAHDLAQQEVVMMIEPRQENKRRDLGMVVDRMLLMLHMIQQPRIVERRLVAHDERLQRSRAKAGKRPLVHYHEVTVHVTRRERAATAAAQDLERRTGRRLHHVRAFYRVRCGRLERVYAHWRGSAELGVSVATGHRVSR